MADLNRLLVCLDQLALARQQLETREAECGRVAHILTDNAVELMLHYVRVTGKNRTEYFSPAGKLVAREIDGATYDGQGRLASRERQGMRVLGQLYSA